MRFTPSLLDEIKARLPMSAIAGRRVKLVKAGREWKGLSPFNAERTPSFYVNDQKQRFFDFSSGKNGNIFDFLMETEGVSFPEAVERLAAEAGVNLPKASAEAEARERRVDSLVEVMELTAKFFEANLGDRAGANARRYLQGRDLPPPVQKQFRLGYAPDDRFALRDHLAGKGVPAEAMIEAGLLVHGEDIPVPYDRFRDRVMFPIADPRGRVIAFGGRALKPDAPAKYLNSPETPLFHKGATLYNHHNARKAAHERGGVIVVEGYVDVIAMTRAGFANAVAPLGTALTEDQIQLLWRMAEEPVLLFDGDNAGKRAAHRAVDVALPFLEPGRSLKFAFMTGGKDPDELLRTAGAEAVKGVVERTAPLVDVLFAREVEKAPLDTPERKVDLQRRLVEAANAIRDEALRSAYRDELLQRWRALGGRRPPYDRANPGQRSAGGDQRYPRQPPRRGDAPMRMPPSPATPELLRSPAMERSSGALPPREAALIAAAINNPALIERDVEAFAELAFANADARSLQSGVLAAIAEGVADRQGMQVSLARQSLERTAAGLLSAVHHAEWWTGAEAEADLAARAFRQAMDLHLRVSALDKEKRSAEEACHSAGTDAEAEASFQRLKEVVIAIAAIEAEDVESDGFAPPLR
jgi:DNA primase